MVDTGWAIRKGIAILNKGLMKKQTAVEYLVEQLFPKALSAEQYYHIEKAKAMEKHQIVNARLSLEQSITLEDALEKSEQYFNETYNTDTP